MLGAVKHPAGPYSRDRLFEWWAGVTMVLIAATLALPGDTLERGALRPIAEAGFSEGSMAAFFGTVGALRIAALYANGNINNGIVRPSGATIRAWGALAGALIWGELALTLVVDAFRAEAPSFLIPVFGTALLFELLSCYQARLDAVRRRDALGVRLAELEERIGG